MPSSIPSLVLVSRVHDISNCRRRFLFANYSRRAYYPQAICNRADIEVMARGACCILNERERQSKRGGRVSVWRTNLSGRMRCIICERERGERERESTAAHATFPFGSVGRSVGRSVAPFAFSFAHRCFSASARGRGRGRGRRHGALVRPAAKLTNDTRSEWKRECSGGPSEMGYVVHRSRKRHHRTTLRLVLGTCFQ